jgi:hypothetical protein
MPNLSRPPKLSLVKSGLAGMGCGLSAAVATFLPLLIIQMWLLSQLERIAGPVHDLPLPLLLLFTGLPLPWFLILVVPIGGAFFGLIWATLGAWQAQQRKQSVRSQWRAALLLGALGGATINLLVSFWAQ